MTKDNQKISRLLSKVLRHEPSLIGITLDNNGWVDISVLIKAIKEQGYRDFTINDLKEIVAENDKKRFAFNEGNEIKKIRASQGHSIDVDLDLKPEIPPPVLYHGTATRFYDSIKKTGLTKQSRQHVHLSDNIKTAESVGKRHGKCQILVVDSMLMYLQGYKWYKSQNGVWLTDHVPAKYIKIHSFVDEKFYIHTGDYVGNCMLFWGLNSEGYTTDISKAQKYSLDDAKQITSNPDRRDRAYSIEYIKKNLTKTVDMQNISPNKKITKQKKRFINTLYKYW